MRTDWENLKAGDVVQARNGQRFTIGQVITRDLPIDLDRNTKPCVIAASQERFAEMKEQCGISSIRRAITSLTCKQPMFLEDAEPHSHSTAVANHHHLTPSATTKDLFNKVYSDL